MSHFTVLVRIPSTFTLETLHDKLTEMMVPFQEHSSTGECPAEFMEFEDNEDEYREEYDNESRDWMRHKETGEIASTYDDRFRANPNTKGSLGCGVDWTYPDVWELVSIRNKDHHATLEDFVASYHGVDARDERTGRYGYWENPNRRWDWWKIGGRWRAKLPVKPSRFTDDELREMRAELEGFDRSRMDLPQDRLGWSDAMRERWNDKLMVDTCRIQDLDRDRCAEISRKMLDDAWSRWERLRCGQLDQKTGGWDYHDAHDARQSAGDLGLLRFIEASALTDTDRARYRCVRQDRKDALDYYDCYDDRITREQFVARWANRYHPAHTFARLDLVVPGLDGKLPEERDNEIRVQPKASNVALRWIEPGKMGWFGCASDTPETAAVYDREFIKWLDSGNECDWIVVVDCHI